MQKKLIALAIAGLSGAAFAQSNVTVYGQMNMAYESLSNSTAVGTGNMSRMSSMDSRLGFKGEEAVGNGLKAVFTQEFGVAADSNGMYTSNNAAGTSGLGASSRQTFVGLSGSFGTVTMGRQYTPYFEAAAAIDPFGASTTSIGSTASLHPIAAIARANNAFKYVGAFDAAGGKLIVAGLYGMGEKAGAAGSINPNVTNLKLAYASGPLLVGITTIKLNDNVGGTAGDGASLQGATATAAALPAAPATTVGGWTKGTAFGGTYDFKVAKLHVLNDRVTANTAAGAAAADLNIWTLAATIPMGVHTIKVAYHNRDNRLAGATADDSKQYALGYSYAMSKRTNLIANYANVSNSGAAANSVLGTGYKNALQLGMQHSF